MDANMLINFNNCNILIFNIFLNYFYIYRKDNNLLTQITIIHN